METTVCAKVHKKEKCILKGLAKKFGMTTSEYIKHKLFDQNSDLSNAEDIYYCPSGEHYNYVIARFSMLNFMLLDSLIKKENGQKEGVNIINKAVAASQEKLETGYGYRKVKDKNDE